MKLVISIQLYPINLQATQLQIAMNTLLNLAADPVAWAALLSLIAMEVVLGIDNLIFIAILTNRMPKDQR